MRYGRGFWCLAGSDDFHQRVRQGVDVDPLRLWFGRLAGLFALFKGEYTRLRRAVSDLTLDKMILTEAARGNF